MNSTYNNSEDNDETELCARMLSATAFEITTEDADHEIVSRVMILPRGRSIGAMANTSNLPVPASTPVHGIVMP